MKKVGVGTFGVVYKVWSDSNFLIIKKAKVVETNEIVAIKKVF